MKSKKEILENVKFQKINKEFRISINLPSTEYVASEVYDKHKYDSIPIVRILDYDIRMVPTTGYKIIWNLGWQKEPDIVIHRPVTYKTYEEGYWVTSEFTTGTKLTGVYNDDTRMKAIDKLVDKLIIVGEDVFYKSLTTQQKRHVRAGIELNTRG